MTFVGSYVGLSRWLLMALPVFVLAGLRFGIAALCLIGWLRRQPGEPVLRPLDQRRLAGAAFIGTFLFSVCMLEGIARSGAVLAGIVMATLPGVVAVFARLWLKEAVTPRTLSGIAFATAGIALAASEGRPADLPDASSAWGLVLLLGAVACEACYVVLGRQLAQSVSPQRITAWVNLWGLAFTAPFALWQWQAMPPAATFTALHGVALVYYALAASVFSVWLWMRGIRHVGAARAGIYTVCLPVTAALVGMALGESMGWVRLLALGLALVGVVLATTGHPAEQR